MFLRLRLPLLLLLATTTMWRPTSIQAQTTGSVFLAPGSGQQQTMTTSLADATTFFEDGTATIYGTAVGNPTPGEICSTVSGIFLFSYAGCSIISSTSPTPSFTVGEWGLQKNSAGQIFGAFAQTAGTSVANMVTAQSSVLLLNTDDCVFLQAAATTQSATTVLANANTGVIQSVFAGSALPSSDFLAFVQGGTAQVNPSQITSAFSSTAVQLGTTITVSSLGVAEVSVDGLYLVTYTVPMTISGADTSVTTSVCASSGDRPCGGFVTTVSANPTASGTTLYYVGSSESPTIALFVSSFSPSPTPAPITVSATNVYLSVAALPNSDYSLVTSPLTTTTEQSVGANTNTQIVGLFSTGLINTNDGSVTFNAPTASFTVSKDGVYIVTLEGVESLTNTPTPSVVTQFTVFFEVTRLGSEQFGLSSYSSPTAAPENEYALSTSAQLSLLANDIVTTYVNSNAATTIACVSQECWFSMAYLGPSIPTPSPSKSPTVPTHAPSKSPSRSPSKSPSKSPTTSHPSKSPSRSPSKSPSHSPSRSPSKSPITSSPTTHAPTFTGATPSPTSKSPTSQSPSHSPSKSPTTSLPSKSPSHSPTTSRPSKSPSHAPSKSPSRTPSRNPSKSPTTSSPTSQAPTSKSPTSKSPTPDPTSRPTHIPTQLPTSSPAVASSSLSAGAIAGITVGVIVGAGVIVGIIILSLWATGTGIFATTTTTMTGGVAAAASAAHASASAV